MKTIKLCPGWVIFALSCSAQEPSMLGSHSYAGLNLTGTIRTVYAIQATSDIAQSNGWICLAFVQTQSSNYIWMDISAPASGKRFYRAVLTAPTNLVFIPPGTFRMGSRLNDTTADDDEHPQTEVTLTRSFYMGKYEVTQAEYLSVLGSNPSYFADDSNRPVETVTWNEATNYCAQRTQQETAAGRIPEGSEYRLPTETEWEYAYRAWTSLLFYWEYDTNNIPLPGDPYEWFHGNSGYTSHPVGQKLPNPWGLYDMGGNVMEYCQDWYAATYSGARVTDPQGPDSGSFRTRRGGNWLDSGGRAADRHWTTTDSRDVTTGFRVVLAAKP